MSRLLAWSAAIASSGLLAALVAVAPAHAATSPTVTVTTGTATSLTATSETLTGAINNAGSKVEYYFEYGPTTKYGTATPDKPLPGKTGPQAVTATIKNLKTNTTYHWRLVAVTGSGTTLKRVFGTDSTFKSGGTGTLMLTPSALTVTKGMLATPLTCDSTLSCAGKFSVGTRTKDAKTHKLITAVCVSGAAFSIKAGKTETVKGKILPGCLALLKDNKKITAKVTSSPRTGQKALVKSVTVTDKS